MQYVNGVPFKKIPTYSNVQITGQRFIILLIVLLTAVSVGGAVGKNTFQGDPQNASLSQIFNAPEADSGQFRQQTVNYTVVVKENVSDNTRSDVYLKDPTTGQETFFITLLDVYRMHYHNAKYHNGNLYIIHRTGGDEGYQTNPNWIDSLWRYSPQQPAVKLFSVQGLDFRVSDDEQLIAIMNYDDNTGANLTLIEGNGSVLTSINKDQLGGDPSIFPVKWDASNFWVSGGLSPSITRLVKIHGTTFAITIFDLGGLPVQLEEFDLNTAKEIIAFSDHPVFFDAESSEAFKKSGQVVTLFIYDLNTRTQQEAICS
jgi:hypothetical protein